MGLAIQHYSLKTVVPCDFTVPAPSGAEGFPCGKALIIPQ